MNVWADIHTYHVGYRTSRTIILHVAGHLTSPVPRPLNNKNTPTNHYEHPNHWHRFPKLLLVAGSPSARYYPNSVSPGTLEVILFSLQVQPERLCFYPSYALKFQARFGLEKYNLFATYKKKKKFENDCSRLRLILYLFSLAIIETTVCGPHHLL